jgi:hypothetical protein
MLILQGGRVILLFSNSKFLKMEKNPNGQENWHPFVMADSLSWATSFGFYASLLLIEDFEYFISGV